MFPQAATAVSQQVKQKPRKARKGQVYPAPCRSGRLYCRIAPSMVHIFRFLLEAEDNLGLMTVVDRWGAVLMLRFSPHQERELRECLAGMQETVHFTVLPDPALR